jgi:hypothetical protein
MKVRKNKLASPAYKQDLVTNWDDAPYPLGLSAIEQRRVTKFVATHRARHYRMTNCVFTLRFTPTGVGLAIKVICSCKKKCDITDYESW